MADTKERCTYPDCECSPLVNGKPREQCGSRPSTSRSPELEYEHEKELDRDFGLDGW